MCHHIVIELYLEQNFTHSVEGPTGQDILCVPTVAAWKMYAFLVMTSLGLTSESCITFTYECLSRLVRTAIIIVIMVIIGTYVVTGNPSTFTAVLP
jgi:hypothetical protein